MILNYYISQLKLLLGEHLDDRFLIATLNEYRSTWIKNRLNQNRTIEDDIVQTLTCVELELVDESECPIVVSNSYVLKSKNKIPKTVILNDRDSILAVRNSKILSERYNYVSKDHAVYSNSGKTNKRKIFAFMYNDYMYIKLSKDNPKIPLLTYISIEGIFENPNELSESNCCSGNPCFNPLVEDYPISNNLWVYIKSQIIGNNTEGNKSNN